MAWRRHLRAPLPRNSTFVIEASQRRLKLQRITASISILLMVVSALSNYFDPLKLRHHIFLTRSALAIAAISGALAASFLGGARVREHWFLGGASLTFVLFHVSFFALLAADAALPDLKEELAVSPPSGAILIFWALGAAGSSHFLLLGAVQLLLSALYVPLYLAVVPAESGLRGEAALQAAASLAVSALLTTVTAAVRHRDMLVRLAAPVSPISVPGPGAEAASRVPEAWPARGGGWPVRLERLDTDPEPLAPRAGPPAPRRPRRGRPLPVFSFKAASPPGPETGSVRGGAGGSVRGGAGRRWSTSLAMRFEQPEEEAAFRAWGLASARGRTLPLAALFFAAFLLTTCLSWARYARRGGPTPAASSPSSWGRRGPAALLLALALPPRAWRALFLRGPPSTPPSPPPWRPSSPPRPTRAPLALVPLRAPFPFALAAVAAGCAAFLPALLLTERGVVLLGELIPS
eukprot:tig00001669_g9555.t1